MSLLPENPAAAPSVAQPREEGRGSRIAISTLVFAALCCGSLLLWRLQIGKDQREAAYARVAGAQEVGHRVSRVVREGMEPAGKLVAAFRRGKIIDDQQFQQAVNQVGPPAPFMSIAWIDRDGWCQYVWTRSPSRELAVGNELGSLETWGHQLDAAARGREPRVVNLGESAGRPTLIAVFPAISGEGSSAAYLGSLAVHVDWSMLLAPLAGEARDFDVTVYGGGTAQAVTGKPIPDSALDATNEAVPLYNRLLRVRTRASPNYLARSVSTIAPWVLWCGLALSCAVTSAVWVALKRRSQAVVAARRHLAAIESLTSAAGAISSTPGAGEKVLERLAASARAILDVNLVAIAISDEKHETLRVLAQDGLKLRPVGEVYQLKSLPRTRACMESKQVLVVADAALDDAVNAQAMYNLGSRAGLFVPLVVEDRAIGLMFAGATQPRQFSDSEVHLAAALGMQAGVIMANVRLYEQMQQALEAQGKLSAKHESLYTLSTELYRAGDLHRSLQNLADSAPALLNVDLCVVALREGRGDDMVISAITDTDNLGSLRGFTYHTTGTNDHVVMNSGEAIEVEQGDADPSIHPAFRQRLKIGSIIYQPLLGSFGRRIGLLGLIRHVPGAFTAEQRELSQVLASRASAAIETIRFHELSRRAAETQEMLLRELNHRVKNNLASIVALLSMERPTMSDEAQDWLNRVTGRIATMARTHELFVGGNDTVSIQDLISKLLPSLSVILPPGAEVKTDFQAAHVHLGTERAVSLAMVLNELCWNALEHGTSENGVLYIEARSDQGRLLIRIGDEGKGDQSQPMNGRGTGLRLVEGLVTRELRGQFSMDRTAQGTVAKIDIPLEQQEEE